MFWSCNDRAMVNVLLFQWFGGHLENNHFPEVRFLKILSMLIPTPNTNQISRKIFCCNFTILINLAITNTLLLCDFNSLAAILDCHIEFIGYQIIQQF